MREERENQMKRERIKSNKRVREKEREKMSDAKEKVSLPLACLILPRKLLVVLLLMNA